MRVKNNERWSRLRTLWPLKAFLTAGALVFAASVSGQAPNASIGGVVRGTAGQPLVGALITVSSPDTELEQSTTSDSEGRYSFASLPRGIYSLTATMSGYQQIEKRGIELTVGARREEILVISPLANSGQGPNLEDYLLVITPPALQVETVASSVSVVVEESRLLRLPLANRNVYSLFLLQPGVTSQGAIDARGLSFSVHGQRVSGSNYQLDGADNNNIVLTGPVTTVSADAVQEFRMINSNFSSENGRATAFVAQVATRSGTNQIHGSGFEILGNDAMNANSYQNNAQQMGKSRFLQNQGGYSLGGPIVKRKTFFWSSAELSRLSFSAPIDVQVPSSIFVANLPIESVARRLLSEIPSYPSVPTAADPNLGEVKFQAPNTINTILTSQRLDHHFANESDRLMFRYALSSTAEHLSSSAWGEGASALSNETIGYPSLVPTDRFQGQNGMAGWTHLFTSDRYSDLRVAWSREGIHLPRPRPDLPNLQSLDGATLPASPRQAEQRENNHVIQLSEAFSERSGRSTLTAGVQVRSNLSNSLSLGLQNETLGGDARIPNGLYVFDSLASFGAGLPFAFSMGLDSQAKGTFQLPDLNRKYRSNEYGMFLQEDLRLTPHFSMNAGLRYEYYGVLHNTDRSQDVNFYFGPGVNVDESLANGTIRNSEQNPGDLHGRLYRPDWLNLAPSIGIAWDPFGRGRSVLRAGYAIAFDRIPDTVRDLRSNHLQIVNCITIAGCTPDSFRLPAGSLLPLLSQNQVIASPYSVVQLDENLHTPYAQNWSVGLQQTLTPNLLFEIGHVGSMGRKLLSRDVINRGAAINQGVPGLPPPNGSIGEDTYISNAGSSSYLAMEIGLLRRSSKGLQYQASYTWSHSIDNQSDVFEGTRTDPRTGAFALAGFTKEFDARVDRGNSDFDQRHNLVFNAIWSIPNPGVPAKWAGAFCKSWTISFIGAYRSGFPVTVIGNSFLADPGSNLLNNRLDFVGTPEQSLTLSQPTPVPGGVQWLDPNLFRPAIGHVGNVGRGAIRGPGFWNYDMALLRDFDVSDRAKLQFRAEFYNVFNHANLSAPVTTYYSDPSSGTVNPDFGRAYYGLNGAPSRYGMFPLESPSRKIQLGLRISF